MQGTINTLAYLLQNTTAHKELIFFRVEVSAVAPVDIVTYEYLMAALGCTQKLTLMGRDNFSTLQTCDNGNDIAFIRMIGYLRKFGLMP